MTDLTGALPPETNRFAWVRHLLPRIVIGSLIAAALVGVYAVIIGRWDDTCWRLIGTIALLVFFSLVSWYDADVSARRAPWFGAVSVTLSAFLLLDGLVKLWAPALDGASGPEGMPGTSSWGFFGWIALVVVVRLGLLHIHLVLNTQQRFTGPIMSKVTVCTLVLVGALTVGLAAPLVFDRVEFSEAYWRMVATIAILDALGTILIPLTYSLFGPKTAKDGEWRLPRTLRLLRTHRLRRLPRRRRLVLPRRLLPRRLSPRRLLARRLLPLRLPPRRRPRTRTCCHRPADTAWSGRATSMAPRCRRGRTVRRTSRA
ncbi:hypothetical protein [Streptomyces sp. L7]|uniref:hypothetical protein n=1 Tax=Streptomyces sp. L7 TaxID=3423954 RepID=UPI003D995EA8